MEGDDPGSEEYPPVGGSPSWGSPRSQEDKGGRDNFIGPRYTRPPTGWWSLTGLLKVKSKSGAEI